MGVERVWVDTLCIPQEPQERRKAIIGMEKIYSNALGCVVVTPTYLACDGHLAYRVVCSDWNSRVWTLQEGWLANVTYILLEDGLTSYDAYVRSMYGREIPGLEARCLMLTQYVATRAAGVSLDTVFKMCSSRSTSKKADMYNGVAALLGGEYYSTDEEETLKMMVRCGCLIDVAITLIDVPRLTATTGACWAPSAMQGYRLGVGTGQYACATEKGLQLTLLHARPFVNDPHENSHHRNNAFLAYFRRRFNGQWHYHSSINVPRVTIERLLREGEVENVVLGAWSGEVGNQAVLQAVAVAKSCMDEHLKTAVSTSTCGRSRVVAQPTLRSGMAAVGVLAMGLPGARADTGVALTTVGMQLSSLPTATPNPLDDAQEMRSIYYDRSVP
ncbi:unnamed protein product [Calypogeia fissa]